jgi:hypothetical protein
MRGRIGLGLLLAAMLPRERVVENPIDVRVMDVLHTLKNNITKFGGKPEVIVVSALDHFRHLKNATEVHGMRVVVRSWAPEDRFLVLSEDDLRNRDDR